MSLSLCGCNFLTRGTQVTKDQWEPPVTTASEPAESE
jgi:hypothetical protein